MLSWRRADMGKVKLFLLPSSMYPISLFFAPTVCWNFTGLLDLPKGTVILGWLSELVFFVRKMAENSYFSILMMSCNKLVCVYSKLCCDFDGNFIKCIDEFGQNWYFPTQSHPTDEYSMSLHLSRIFFYFFQVFCNFQHIDPIHVYWIYT